MADTGFDVDACTATVRRDRSGRRVCNIDDCDGTHRARGLCGKHYDRWNTWGDPHVVKPKFGHPPRPTTPARPSTGLPEWLDLDQLAATTPTTGWEENAGCIGQPYATMYPTDRRGSIKAKGYCEICPVRYECLAVNLEAFDRYDFGVWGGTSRGERKKIRRALDAREATAA